MPAPLRVKVQVTAGPAAGRSFEFDQPDTFLFGRSADARISLPDDPYVSRNHFVLEISPPDCKITDLGSKNGTFVNRVRFGGTVAPRAGVQLAPDGARETRLASGDEIVVGDTQMRVQIEVESLCAACGNWIPPADRPAGAAPAAPLECKTCQARRAAEQAARSARAQAEDTIEHPAPPVPADAHSGYTATAPAMANPSTRPETLPPSPAPAPAGMELSNTLRDVLSNPDVKRRPVACVQCGSDVTVEVGLRGQVDGAEYVCHRCRSHVKAEPVRRLRALRDKPERDSSTEGSLNLDDYELLEQVGEGGMAKVYRAQDKRSGKVVAIKVMLPDVASTPEGVRSFMREMDITRQLRHVNIVDLMGFVKARGTYFLVMEFVEGRDLAGLVRECGGKIPLAKAAPLMLGVLDGLGHAHRAHITVKLAEGQSTEVVGIVHRDLKPSNIFLAEQTDGSLVPKIADFGLAKAFRAAGLTDMTRPGEVSGTPGYWPREQLVHYRYLAPASDVFSAAAVFYEMLTGQRIRQGFNEMMEACRKAGQPPGLAQYIQVICSNPTVPIRQRDPAMPSPVATVIDKALKEGVVSGSPDQVRQSLGDMRFLDARAFGDALRDALRECGAIA